MQGNFLSKYVLRPISQFVLAIILFTTNLQAKENHPISFGPVTIGENRLKLDVRDFSINLKLKANIKSKVVLKKNSIQWIRIDDVLLTPRALIDVYFQGEAKDFNLVYRNQSITMQQDKDGLAHSEFYVSLFQFDKIDIYKNGNHIGDITFTANKITGKRQTTLIDYSCARNGISVKGLDHEFISLGCRMTRIGSAGQETPMLEVLWTAANYRLRNQKKAPYLAIFTNSNPIKVEVVDHNGQIKELEISAKVPARLHRLNIAYGLGPYAFNTSYDNSSDPDRDDIVRYDEPAVPAFMLYFNYKLDDTTSIRGFDAVVWKKSVFNNLGVYYANDIAKPFDKKLTVTTLLGMQHLYFKFDENYPTRSEPIFPQGIEANYNHAFGIENYLIGGGAFVSFESNMAYQNIWVRWGKGIFWELNYIHWGTEGFTATMWGLSAGFFLGSFL
jgi:hypothetical protein